MTEPHHQADEEPPPILGSWTNVYTLLMAQLALTIAIFYAVTWWAS